MPVTFTPEQEAFVDAIRDFAARECGTARAARAADRRLQEPHNQELYEKIAELGWLGRLDPRGVRRRRRRDGRRLHLPRGDRCAA